MNRRTPIAWISTTLTAFPGSALASALTLVGVIALTPGCASKTGCLNCHINGVMNNPSAPNPAPTTTLELQIEPNTKPVSSVEVTIKNEEGGSETHSYGASEVSGITVDGATIPDTELYDVEGQPPVEGTVTVEFEGGGSFTDSLGITPEGTTGTPDVGDGPVGDAKRPGKREADPVEPKLPAREPKPAEPE